MTFDRKIEIQRKVKNGDGSFAKEEWKPLCRPWANWQAAFGSEFWAAESVQAQRPATVTIRFRNDVDERCRILYGGIYYEILSVDNIRQRGLFLAMKVRAAVNG